MQKMPCRSRYRRRRLAALRAEERVRPPIDSRALCRALFDCTATDFLDSRVSVFTRPW